MAEDLKLRSLELAVPPGGTQEEVLKRATAYLAFLTSGPAAQGGAKTPTTAVKTPTTAAKTSATGGAKTPATGKPNTPAKPNTSAKPNTPAKPPAQVGKHSLEQVREKLREVVTAEGLGKPSAKEVLDTEGGVTALADLKPADYDKVWEACDVLLKGGEAGEQTSDAGSDFNEEDPTA